MATDSPVYISVEASPNGGWLFLGTGDDGRLQQVTAKPAPEVLDFIDLTEPRLIVSHVESFTQALLKFGVKNPPHVYYSEQQADHGSVREWVLLNRSLKDWLVAHIEQRQSRAPSDRLDMTVARILAAESHYGYQQEGVGTVHPYWNVWTPSGRITSSHPSLSNLPLARRREFPAHPGYRWFLMGYEHPELLVLATLLESAELLRLARLTHEQAVKEVALELTLDDKDAEAFLALVTRRLVTPEVAVAKLHWELSFAVTRVNRFHFVYGTRPPDIERVLMKVTTSALGRPLSTPKDAGSKISNVLTDTIAVVMKLLIAETYNWAELGSGHWIGLHGAIPLVLVAGLPD